MLQELNLPPSAAAVCHALTAGLRGSCRVQCNCPVSSEAEQRANFESEHQGDPAAPVISQTKSHHPETAHLTVTLRYIPQLAVKKCVLLFS